MAISNGSLLSGKGTIPEIITSNYPLGMIFYPTETIELVESRFDEEKLRQLELETLEVLRESSIDLGQKLFKVIKLPPWFTLEEVHSRWLDVVNSTFEKLISQIENEDRKLTKEDSLLLNQIQILRKIELAINFNQKGKLKAYLKNYRSYIQDSFAIVENTLYSFRRQFGKIFLESQLTPKFMTYVSKAINVMISYFYYLQSELDNVITVLRQIISGRGSIDHFKKDTKAVFARILKLDTIQLSLLFKLLELRLFMDIWSSESTDELFAPKEKYSPANLDNEHFIAILNNLNQLSNKLHFQLIEVSREREKDVPFTFQNNFAEKDKEKMILISR